MARLEVYPRPEYPRPDRQRGTIEGVDWLNLNGPWQFRFDGDRRGEEEGWFRPDELEWREQIIVPFCWESLAAWGEGDAAGNANYYSTRVFRNPLEVTRANHRSAARYEVGWYRRRICIPNTAAWEGKRVILTVGAADFRTEGWCNGVGMGVHEGGYTPFEFDLTDHLARGSEGTLEGLVVLRVEDLMENHEQPVGKQWKWYTTTSGIWQTVYVEPRSRSYIECFRIHTNLGEKTAEFHVDCVLGAGERRLVLEITPPKGGGVIRVEASATGRTTRLRAGLEPVEVWNPNEPCLYKACLYLLAGDVLEDRVRTYFGMREIDSVLSEDASDAAVLRLNGAPRYLRGALYQSYYPDGVYTAGDVEVMKNDILYAKKAGFNFLRIHIKIDDPMFLYLADTLGMMLMADFPNFGEGGDTPLGRKRFEEMMRGAIRRDYNHPSIVAWCLFNETWGFGGLVEFVTLFEGARGAGAGEARGPEGLEAGAGKRKLANLSSHRWVQQMWELAKRLDPTRLIEDMSVVHWEHLDYFAHGDTDINSWHFYESDYQRAKEHIERVVSDTFAGSTFNYAEGFRHRGQPLINSEYGGVGALDGDRDVSWSFKFLTNELRRHGKISAYIYTELHDVEWEFNGFLNYDRTPKEFGYDPRMINESDVLPIDAPPVQRCRPGEKVEVKVASSHYSTKARSQVQLRWRFAGMDTRGRVMADMMRGSAPIEFPHHRVAHAHTIELRMPEMACLGLLWVEAVTAEGETAARNFVHFFVSAGYPPEREELPRMTVLRAAPHEWESSEWSGRSTEREAQRARDCCAASGHGFFEWGLAMRDVDLAGARRLRVLCEASSRRIDTPQTDDDHFPTTLQMSLNGVPVYEATIANHPHDARGVLSYLRGGKGAYGYLAHATVEGESLRRIVSGMQDGKLRFRCGVPADALAQGGLSVYGAECGRYPVAPTVVVVEW